MNGIQDCQKLGSVQNANQLIGIKKKKCFQCLSEKDLAEFYLTPQNKDGHAGSCKECVKKTVRTYYLKNRQHCIAYEKERYKNTARKEDNIKRNDRYRKKYPEKYKALTAVYRAKKNGKLQQKNCEICGEEKTDAHHEDYHKPLEVTWLCKRHHLKRHGKKPYNQSIYRSTNRR